MFEVFKMKRINCLVLLFFCTFSSQIISQVDDSWDTLVAGGDVIIARREHDYVARHGMDWPFRSVTKYLKDADACLVNLETCIALGGKPAWKGERNPCYFRARPEMLNILIKAGIDIVTCANNHAGDYGIESVLETIYWTKKAGLVSTGVGENPKQALRPRLVMIGNTRVAICGMDTTMPSYCVSEGRPGTNHVPEGDLEIFEARINWLSKWAKRRCDILILTIHWGRNWDRITSNIHRKMARMAIDAGVDLIIGHSAHRLQGVEIIKNRMVVYDMGNLMIDGIYRPQGQLGGIFKFFISKKGVHRLEMIPVWLPAARTVIPTREQRKQILSEMKDLCNNLGTNLKIEKNKYGEDIGVIEIKDPKVSPKGSLLDGLEFIKLPRTRHLKPPRAEGVIVETLPKEAKKIDPPIEIYPGIELVGYNLPKEAEQGTQIRVRTWWRITKKINSPLLVSLELISGGKIVRSARYNRHDPGDWVMPFRYMKKGEIVEDDYPARLGRAVPPGPCEIRALIYDPTKPKGKRKSKNSFTLGIVDIIDWQIKDR